MDNQRSTLLNWAYYSQGKTMEELRHSLLYTTLELEQTRLVVQEELRKRDDQLMNLKDLLSKTVRERDDAQQKYKRLVFGKLLLQQQQQQAAALLSGISSIEDEPRKGIDSNNGFSSSDCEESIVSSPIIDPFPLTQLPPPQPQPQSLPQSTVELVPEKPLPEKGKLLQAVMKAGPLLQTLLLAGPLPQWRHPPPPLESFEIPPVAIPPPPTTWIDETMEELRHSLLYTTLELEQTRLVVQEELRKRDDQLMNLKDLLSKTVRERDDAQQKCQRLVFEKLLLQQQQQQAAGPLSGISSIEDEPRKGIDSNNGFSSSDCEEIIVSSPIIDPVPPTQLPPPQPQPQSLPQSTVELVPEKPLPEKGKLLQAVMKAGPLSFVIYFVWLMINYKRN